MIGSCISKHKGYAKTENMHTMGSSYNIQPTAASEDEIGKGFNSGTTRQSNSAKKKPFCPVLIPNRKALVVWTRVIFGVTVLTCTTVILVSIWLMLDCRDKLQPMRGVLEHNTKYCTNMGLQVLFACCVVLFAVFGLGCIGRQLTGYAMLIISGVAIFQSTMTLVFNECQTGVKDDFLTTTASGFKECRLGSKNPPFELAKTKDLSKSTSSNNEPVKQLQTSSEGTTNRLKQAGKEPGRQPEFTNTRRRRPKTKQNQSKDSKTRHVSFKRHKKDDDDFINQILDDINLTERQSDSKLSCDKNSAYVRILELFLPGKDVSKCLILCEIYRDLCSDYSGKGFHENANLGGSSDQGGATTNLNQEQNGSSAASRNLTSADQDDQVVTQSPSSYRQVSQTLFEQTTKSCSVKMWGEIRKFCFYDNVIFMPLSLIGPVFYILLSLAFMYLGHCDTHLSKHGDDDNSQRGKTPDFEAIEPLPRARSVSFLSRLFSGRDDDSWSPAMEADLMRAAGISGAVSTPQLNVVLSEKTSLGLAATAAAAGRRSRYYHHYGNIIISPSRDATTNIATTGNANYSTGPTSSRKTITTSLNDEHNKDGEGCSLLTPQQPPPPPHLNSGSRLPTPSTSPSHLSLPSSVSSCSTVERYLITSDSDKSS